MAQGGGEVSNLPEWIQNHKSLSDTFGYVHDKKIFKALEIAWKALEKMERNHMLNCSSKNQKYCKPYLARDALLQIERLKK